MIISRGHLLAKPWIQEVVKGKEHNSAQAELLLDAHPSAGIACHTQGGIPALDLILFSRWKWSIFQTRKTTTHS